MAENEPDGRPRQLSHIRMTRGLHALNRDTSHGVSVKNYGLA